MKRNVNLKIDFNLLMSGTWVLERKGRQKIHCFEKKVGNGKIVIYNPLDAPSPLDSKVLDFLMVKSQENDWAKEIVIPAITHIVKALGLGKRKQTVERIKKALKILKNTHIEFYNCFIDTGVLKHFSGHVHLVSISIISEYAFIPKKDGKLGRGNPLQVKVVFSDSFISLCKHSLGYKLIPYAPIQGLRDTAYALYKWAWRWFNSEKGYGERRIGDGKKLVEWYKNELNSTANYKYPSKVLERINSAIKQLNEHEQVPFYLKLKQEDGSYTIEIHRKEHLVLKREVPFDKLAERDKAVLVSYAKAVAEEKKIQNVWGFLRSMDAEQVDKWLNEAKAYFGSGVWKDELVENPELLETLRSWAKKKYLNDPNLCEVYFGKDRILKAYEGNKRIVFVCLDKLLARLLQPKFANELKEIFGKEVMFVGKEETTVPA